MKNININVYESQQQQPCQQSSNQNQQPSVQIQSYFVPIGIVFALIYLFPVFTAMSRPGSINVNSAPPIIVNNNNK
jgi:hypothetical protein